MKSSKRSIRSRTKTSKRGVKKTKVGRRRQVTSKPKARKAVLKLKSRKKIIRKK